MKGNVMTGMSMIRRVGFMRFQEDGDEEIKDERREDKFNKQDEDEDHEDDKR